MSFWSALAKVGSALAPIAGAAIGGPIGGAIGGVISGPVKHLLVDKPRYDRDVKLAAETTRYSPWTGLTGQMPKSQPDLYDSVLTNVGAGIAQGQKFAATKMPPAPPPDQQVFSRPLPGLGVDTNLQQGIQPGLDRMVESHPYLLPASQRIGLSGWSPLTGSSSLGGGQGLGGSSMPPMRGLSPLPRGY